MPDLEASRTYGIEEVDPAQAAWEMNPVTNQPGAASRQREGDGP
jgi:hypothetical protein